MKERLLFVGITPAGGFTDAGGKSYRNFSTLFLIGSLELFHSVSDVIVSEIIAYYGKAPQKLGDSFLDGLIAKMESFAFDCTEEKEEALQTLRKAYELSVLDDVQVEARLV